MGKVIHFDISADDPERAMKFYKEVFGWKFKTMDMPEPTPEQIEMMKEMMGDFGQEDMDYWLIEAGPEDAPGINGGLSRRSKPLEESGLNAYVCSIDVTEIDEKVKKIEEGGGEIVMKKMPIPGVGWNVMFKDTEGNLVGMLQADKSANF